MRSDIDKLLEGVYGQDFLCLANALEMEMYSFFREQLWIYHNQNPLIDFKTLYSFINGQIKQLYCKIQISLSPIRVHSIRQIRKGFLLDTCDPIISLTSIFKVCVEQILQNIENNHIFLDYMQQLYPQACQNLRILAEFLYNMNCQAIYVRFNGEGLEYSFTSVEDPYYYLNTFEKELIELIQSRIDQTKFNCHNASIIFQDAQSFCRMNCPYSWQHVLQYLCETVFTQQFQLWTSSIDAIQSLQHKEFNQYYQLFQYYQSHADYLNDGRGNPYYQKLGNKFRQLIQEFIHQSIASVLSINDNIIHQSNIIIEQFNKSIGESSMMCNQYFDSDPQFKNIISLAVSNIFQQQQQFISLLIILIDKTLFEQNMDRMHSILLFLPYLSQNNQFLNDLLIMFQQRFINQMLPTVTWFDKRIIQELKHIYNLGMVTQFDTIVQEVEASQQYQIANEKQSINCLIISTNAWKLFNLGKHLTNDLEMTYIEQQFQSQYKIKHPNRELLLDPYFSKAKIIYRPKRQANKKYIIHLYYTQLRILLQFQQIDSININILFAQSGIDRETFDNELKILINKSILLQDGPTILVNTNFTSMKQNISLFQKRFIQNEQMMADKFKENMKTTIQAYIVKQVKKSKCKYFSELMNDVIATYPQCVNPKTLIEDLIDIGYLQRSEDQFNVIYYTP